MELKLFQTSGLIITGKGNGILVDPDTTIEHPKHRIVVFPTKIKNVKLEEGQIVLAGPGSYEVGGIEVVGTSVGGESEGTIYVATIDGVDVAIVPGLTAPLSDKKVERLEEIGVDVCILMHGTVGQKVLVETAKRIGSNYIVFVKKVEDIDGSVELDVLKVDKDALPEGSEVVVLK